MKKGGHWPPFLFLNGLMIFENSLTIENNYKYVIGFLKLISCRRIYDHEYPALDNR